jgi:hypothetical protein
MELRPVLLVERSTRERALLLRRRSLHAYETVHPTLPSPGTRRGWSR